MKRRRTAETWQQTFEQVMHGEQAPPDLATCRDARPGGSVPPRSASGGSKGTATGTSQAALRKWLGLYFAGVLPISDLVSHHL